MNVRPFLNSDAPIAAHLTTESVRGQWVYLPEQFGESRDPRRIRLVAERAGGVIATASFQPFAPGSPDALRLDFAGDAAAFTPLYLALLVRLPTGFSRLLGVTREDWPEVMHFFHAAGFRNAWQSWGAHLDLTAFGAAPFQPLEEKLFLQGYEGERLREDAPESDWEALHALYRIGLKDAPRNPTTTPDPLTRDGLREVILREEAAFVIRFRGEPIASTRLTLRTAAVESEQTVSHPMHRKKGVATVLKAAALTWARDQGYGRAETGGTVLNLPMLRVNSRLGYRPEPMWITWERELQR
ncbi:GNAT family N-acetyltransferase [Deinococcus hopiensis]|uniref:N-acetyltransferase domain-containing protein n=1 Tax=Deinococcus hopiensis KR-140 TaxID=695939 RepID=A0A1W1VT21_9DEIO|nr:GNAT family N-acetyltransferase [Deinococcus hopiensis]SMB96251.1 hypothetical protein SAMN00790413_03221 [Deinococcus hopiensis KR-140]